MKKSLVLFLIVGVLVVGGLIWSRLQIREQQDKIMITEETVSGQLSEAAGLEIVVRTQNIMDRIRWETKLKVQTDQTPEISCRTKTELRYHMNQSERSSRNGAPALWNDEILELRYEDGYHVGYAGTAAVTAKEEGILELIYYPSVRKMFAELAKSVPAGETVSMQVAPVDYYSYYPLYMEMKAGPSTVWYTDEWNVGEFLGVKVPEDHLMNVTITKNHPNGAVTEISAEPISGSIQIQSPAVLTDQYVFYVIYGVRHDDGAIVLPELKNGNGIYCLPFVDREDGRHMMTEKMQMMFELDFCPVGLLTDSEEERLYLLGRDARKLVCKVLQIEQRVTEQGQVPVLTEVQELQLGSYPGESELFLAEFSEDALWMVFGDGTILFCPDLLNISHETMQIEIIRGKIANDNFSYSGKKGWDYDLDYTDGKLALVCAKNYWRNSFRVYVFDKNSTLYEGEFLHSLDAQNSYREYCLQPEKSLEISWGE